jgi:hypothetical protein
MVLSLDWCEDEFEEREEIREKIGCLFGAWTWLRDHVPPKDCIDPDEAWERFRSFVVDPASYKASGAAGAPQSKGTPAPYNAVALRDLSQRISNLAVQLKKYATNDAQKGAIDQLVAETAAVASPSANLDAAATRASVANGIAAVENYVAVASTRETDKAALEGLNSQLQSLQQGFQQIS